MMDGYRPAAPNVETDILGDDWVARLRREHRAKLMAATDLPTLVRAMHDTVKFERFTFDNGETITVRGYIGRLPYSMRVTREWGDNETAEDVAYRTLRERVLGKDGA